MLCLLGALVVGAVGLLPFVSAPSELPLSALCAHLSLLYVSIVGSWRLSLTPIGQCASSALVAAVLCAPLDLLGARHPWCAWHANDAGVSYASTLCCLVHAFFFHALLHAVALRRDMLRPGSAIAALAALSLLYAPCTLLLVHLLPVPTAWLSPGPGLAAAALRRLAAARAASPPGAASLAMWVCILAAITGREAPSLLRTGRVRARPMLNALAHECWSSRCDQWLWRLATLHLGVVLLTAVLTDPAAALSEGLHQPRGPCDALRRHVLPNERPAAPSSSRWPAALDCGQGCDGRRTAAAKAPRKARSAPPPPARWLATWPRNPHHPRDVGKPGRRFGRAAAGYPNSDKQGEALRLGMAVLLSACASLVLHWLFWRPAPVRTRSLDQALVALGRMRLSAETESSRRPSRVSADLASSPRKRGSPTVFRKSESLLDLLDAPQRRGGQVPGLTIRCAEARAELSRAARGQGP
jgi:hypothetical protein